MTARIAHRPVPPTIVSGSGLTRSQIDGSIRPADWQPKSDRQIALRLAACLALAVFLFGVVLCAAAMLP